MNDKPLSDALNAVDKEMAELVAAPTPLQRLQSVAGKPSVEDYAQRRHARPVLPVTAPPAGSLEATLADRGAKYGPFAGHAEVTQDLKRVIVKHLTKRNKVFADDQQECLDMIFHKIGRAVNGDADYDDTWVDMAGYPQLVADRLRGKNT
jgi:hypothetical protein